jgi:hypothetical protein
MSAPDLSTAFQPAPTKTSSQLAATEAARYRQETDSASTSTAKTHIWEVGLSLVEELLQPCQQFVGVRQTAAAFSEYPAVDTLHDESIVRRPTISCSELGSKRIRLLKITPGPLGSTIECEVNTCFPDQAPRYTAILYTWGSPSGFQEIFVRGQLNSVPKNL